jgi:AraC-like DNA-binding protein
MIALFVPDRLAAHIQHVLAGEGEFLHAKSWHHLDEIIRSYAVEVVIADPAADGTLKADEISRLLQQYPSLPVVAYVSVAPAQMRAILDLSRTGLEHVILHRFEDSSARFTTLINRVRGDPLSRRLLTHLAGYISQLPLELAAAIEEMFKRPDRFETALDLAVAAGIPSVRLYRSFDVAGLGSPKKLVIAAKLLRAAAYLRNPGYSVRDVAAKVGFKYSRKFTHHCVAVFGMNPGRVRKRLAEEDSLALVRKWLTEGFADDDEETENHLRERIDTF